MPSPIGSVLAVLAAAGALAAGAAAVPGAVPGPPPHPSGAPMIATVQAGYALPLAGEPAVRRPFDAPAEPWSPGHRGVDLAAGAGAQVLAPADGIVTFAGTVVDRGVVTVQHPGGLRSSLEPVTWSVAAGARVSRGQPVGTVQAASGHCAPAWCLHWGVRRGERYLDPLVLLAPNGTVVLLPDR
jgi:murein DD-endopeptidase MepM/ murein hydrolase activator NlpD